MTVAGWITMFFCWIVVTGICILLLRKTLKSEK